MNFRKLLESIALECHTVHPAVSTVFAAGYLTGFFQTEPVNPETQPLSERD